VAYKVVERDDGYVTHDYRCSSCKKEFYVTVLRRERDQVLCEDCSAPAVRLLSLCTFTKKSAPLNGVEKGIKKDLMEAANLEEDLWYGKPKADEEKSKIEREIKVLKGEI